MLKIDKYSNAELRDCFAAAAQADALVCPEEYLRCYEFHADWSDGVQMASFKSGGGDELIMIFFGDSAIIKGFDHESAVNPHAQEPYGLYPGIYEGAPSCLLDALRDEALDFEGVTFCYWRTSNKGPWQKGPVDLRFNDWLAKKCDVDLPPLGWYQIISDLVDGDKKRVGKFCEFMIEYIQECNSSDT